MGKIRLPKYDQEEDDPFEASTKLNETNFTNTKLNLKTTAENSQALPTLGKNQIIKNLVVFSLSFLLQFSAANGLFNLQSSLNSAQNLGVTSLLVASLSFTASCLFLPNILYRYGNFKWPLIFCESSIAFYIMANYYPRFYTLIPVSVFYGLSMGTLWTFQGSLVSFLAAEYSKHSSQKIDQILVKFFGVFFIIFQISKKKILKSILLPNCLNESQP